jgi:glycosyltransferase involved in cell wall biosynthesis
MKICQICAVDFTLKTFIIPLIDEQIKRGNEVVSICSSGKYTDELKEAGYELKSINISRNFNILHHLKSTYLIYKFLKGNSFDIVHVHTPIAAMVGRIGAYFANTPLIIYTAHGFYFHDNMGFFKKSLYIFLERFFGLFTDLLFTQSAEDAITAKKYRLGPRKNIFAIGNGVSVKDFIPKKKSLCKGIRKTLDIPENAFVIGMICRLVKEKGVEEFLEAAQLIAKKNKDCFFLLIGERQDHDHAKNVDDALEKSKLELEKRLILTGYRSDIPDLLCVMDLFVLPSWREGMPRSIIEAMMMEVPVLATDIRGSREEVIPNVTGDLVPIKSPKKLAAAMEKFLINRDWSKNLGIAGRARALELYDEKKIIDFQLQIIDQTRSKRF